MNIQSTMQNPYINDERKAYSFSVENEQTGRIDINIKKYDVGLNGFKTEIFDSNNKLLGYDLFDMSKDDSIFEYDITVLPEHRGKGLGELMHLTLFSQMIENNVNKIDLHSKPTAIYFHAKHGFEPNIKSFDQRQSSLETIAKNQLPNGDVFISKAEKILKEIGKPLSLTFEDNQKYTLQTNALIKEFIAKVLSIDAQDKVKFKSGIDMKLMKDTLLERAEYFNSLFKKQGLPFKIMH